MVEAKNRILKSASLPFKEVNSLKEEKTAKPEDKKKEEKPKGPGLSCLRPNTLDEDTEVCNTIPHRLLLFHSSPCSLSPVSFFVF